MTKDEFRKFKFSIGTNLVLFGKKYTTAGVDFASHTIGIYIKEDSQAISWVPCEDYECVTNIEI